MFIKKLRYNVENLIAREISSLSRYYDGLYHYKPLNHDTGKLLDAIDCPRKHKIADDETLPDLTGQNEKRSIVLLNGNFNHNLDIQNLLSEIHPKLARTSRVVVVAYNPYFRWLYALADKLGIRTADDPVTFITRSSLNDLAKLSGYEVVRIRPVGYFPETSRGFGKFFNRVMPAIPYIRWLGITNVIVLRPIVSKKVNPSLSVIIPARNEMGNIESALLRMPKLGDEKVEVVFVEGHSKDGTWEEIRRVSEKYSSSFKIKAFQQTGVGKNDAVRLGLSKSTGHVAAVLDADLTMPPEMLDRFYEAYRQGKADFINGNRLVYPMENEAMRFLNWLANVFFAKSVGLVLDVPLGDCLCGTKLFALHDYKRMEKWRENFGEFDPFGDFDFLFPAAELALGIVDVPIRYHARTYGETQISRFTHGFMLLKMTVVGLFRVYMGKVE